MTRKCGKRRRWFGRGEVSGEVRMRKQLATSLVNTRLEHENISGQSGHVRKHGKNVLAWNHVM